MLVICRFITLLLLLTLLVLSMVLLLTLSIPFSSYPLASYSLNNHYYVIDIERGMSISVDTELHTQLYGSTNGLSPDGAWLAIVSQDRIDLLDVRQNQRYEILSLNIASFSQLSIYAQWSQDSRHLLVNGVDGIYLVCTPSADDNVAQSRQIVIMGNPPNANWLPCPHCRSLHASC